MCVLSRVSHVRLLANLWPVARQASLSMGFSRQEHRSGLLCPSPGDLPDPGIIPTFPRSPALQADSLPAKPAGKPKDIKKEPQGRKDGEEGWSRPTSSNRRLTNERTTTIAKVLPQE